uniref:DNA polymerase eta n=1 Tax=Arion vulgaris TaxID=1028688 RepID=A0A0B6ZJQ7_9EUPU
MTDREVVLIDMDCFYVQVEQRLDPSLKGKPCAVVQYKTFRGGGIIAVGYEARAFGVNRNMCGDEAKKKCPDILLARVPESRGKADLTRYREAGAEVIAVFGKFCSCVERASIDEAFLDLSEEVTLRLKNLGDSQVRSEQISNTFVEGYDGLGGSCEWLKKLYNSTDAYTSEYRLAVAASIVEEMRAAVLKETGFTCSAGIASNKMLAKFACGRNKPNKQTVLPMSSVKTLFETLPLQKIRHLGGKLGASLVDDLGLKTMGDITILSEQELQKYCGIKTGNWLYNACRGIETESVSTRVLPKSIGCSKNFRGREMLDTKKKVKFWLSELSKEVSERLSKDKESNKRTARSLTLSVSYKSNSGAASASRACALVHYDDEKICSDAYTLLQQFNTSPGQSLQWSPPLTNLGLSASKFSECVDHQKINILFHPKTSAQTSSATDKRTSAYVDANPNTLEDSAEIDVSDSEHENFKVPESLNHQQRIELSDDHIENQPSSSKPGLECETRHESMKHSPKGCVNSGVVASAGKQSNIQAFFNQRTTPSSAIKGNSSVEPALEIQKVVVSDKCSSVSGSGGEAVGFFARKMKDLTATKSIVSVSHKELVASTSSEQTDNIKDIQDQEETNIVNQAQCSSSDMVNIDSSIKPTNDISSGDFIECDKCGGIISVWEMPEHNDFHFALELQGSDNVISKLGTSDQSRMTTSTTSRRPGVKHKSSSPAKKLGGGKKTRLDKSVQPLTVFFSKR